MTVQPNGTDAKDIALHFVKATIGRATPSIIKRTIVQAKALLSCGYTKEEVIKVIDYIVDVKKTEMYSLGYVSTCINNILKEITQSERKEKAEQKRSEVLEKINTINQEETRKEVKTDDNSTERNRNKSRNFGVQSRFGKELNFDMLEEHRQND